MRGIGRARLIGWTVWLLVASGPAAAGSSPAVAGDQETAALEALRRAAAGAEPSETLSGARRLLGARHGPATERAARLIGGRAAWELARGAETIDLLSPAVTGWPHDTEWAEGVAAFAAALTARGYRYRAAQWAVALAEVYPQRAARLLAALPPGSVTERELRHLGWQASTAAGEASHGCDVLIELAARARPGSSLQSELVAAALARCGQRADALATLRGLAPGVQPAPLGIYDIAVVCPINGRYARFGEALAQGAVLALEEQNRLARYPLRLRVFDSRGDPLRAARASGAAVRAGVGALLGDLLTPATIAVAAAAAAAGTPMISPAATRSEIGTIGPEIFQTIVPRLIQADALAQAAAGKLGLARIAILHPEGEEGQRLAQRFASVARSLGAEIVATTAYPVGQTNFALELEPLAELLPDAVYIPGSPKELMAVIPQFSYYEVDTRLLALEELGLSEVLEATGDYLEAAVFADGYYRVPSRRLSAFRSRYAERYARRPDPYATRGYVAMSLLAGEMLAGADSHQALAAALERRVEMLGVGRDQGILYLGESEGAVALFEVNGRQVSPLE